MGKHPVTGGNTLQRFNKLIAKGVLVMDRLSGTYFHRTEVNKDQDGLFIAKQYDACIHDPTRELSKYRSGVENGVRWDRIGNFKGG
jgi:hypothetical protein